MKTKRILSAILAIVFVLSTLTFTTVSVSADGLTIYLDSAAGNDSANGLTRETAVTSLATAFSKAGRDGTVHIIGTYDIGSGSFPAGTGEVTVAGDGASSVIKGSNSAAAYLNSPLRFENITFDLGQHAHLNTNGHKLTMGEGAVFSTANNQQIHIGAPGASTASEHFVIDGGFQCNAKTSIGTYHTTAGATTTKGDVLIEVLDGTLATLKLSQDGYQDSHRNVYVGGNINVFVGAKGVINAIDNTGRYTVPKGTLNFIVEEGGEVNVSNIASTLVNFEKKEFFWISIPADLDSDIGSVEFSSDYGYVNINCADGYVVEIKLADGTTEFVGGGMYKLNANEKTQLVAFRDDIFLSDNTVDITVAPATPNGSEWPVSVSNEEQFTVSATVTDAEGNTPETVDYYTQYTYDVVLETLPGYVFPVDFDFTINGSGAYAKDNIFGYKVTNYEKTETTVSFTYVADFTDAPEGMKKVSYDGGDNLAYVLTELPAVMYAEEGETFTVASNEVFGLLGYHYDVYTDGTNEYEPGDLYTVGTEDVVLAPVWERDVIYTVNFVDNGATGNCAPIEMEVLEGEIVTIPENPFAKIGYNFTAWESVGGKTYRPGELYNISELYADAGSPDDNAIEISAGWAVNDLAGVSLYVDREIGSEDAEGTEEAPFNTIKSAIASLEDGANATIIVSGTADIIGDLLPADATVGNITIIGKDTDSVLNFNGPVFFGSDTTIENIKINATSGSYIITNGYKTVIGPNLENVEGSVLLDIIDGASGADVAKVDTTIYSNVKLGTYYLGGMNLTSGKGVTGDVSLTVKGAEIETIDLSPKGTVAATIGGQIVANIFNSKIGTLKSSIKHVKSSKATGLIFNDNSMPELDSNLITNLLGRNNYVFIVDSGNGGVATVNSVTARAVKIDVTPTNSGDKAWYRDPSNGGISNKTGSTITLKNVKSGNGVNTVRYGTNIASSNTIEGIINTPVGGAQRDTVRVTTDFEMAKVIVDSWSPELSNGKFAFDTQYTATIRIVPNSGYFFEETFDVAPAVVLNDEGVTVTFNNDGTLSGTYKFTTKTGTPPVLNTPITFEPGEEGTGTPFVYGLNNGYAEILSTITLPTIDKFSRPGYKPSGWREYIDGVEGELYGQSAPYTVPQQGEIVFKAEWRKRSKWEAPSILILYDLTMLAYDRGRNPKYSEADSPIVVANAFANLEHEISGTKGTKKTTFDYEENVTVIASDKGANPIKINNWTFEKSKASVGEYKYLTIVYYYQATNAVAAGGKGWLNFGNCQLPDGSTSKWVGKGIDSLDTVVANKWAAVTFDLSGVAEGAGIDSASFYRQLQICPIGAKPCSELGDATLYLKSLTFSKERPVTQ